MSSELTKTAPVGLEPTTNGYLQCFNSPLLYHAELRRPVLQLIVPFLNNVERFPKAYFIFLCATIDLSTNALREVEATIYAFFEAGKNKDFSSLSLMYDDKLYTKFDENPPYRRQDAKEAFVYDQAAFSNISDMSYKIEDLRIDLVENVAIATFYLSYEGMVINDYSFEGSKIKSVSRVSMVLIKRDEGWKIAHSHFSKIPELKR
jgi:ketosteroid isomerase-like protein